MYNTFPVSDVKQVNNWMASFSNINWLEKATAFFTFKMSQKGNKCFLYKAV